MSVPDVTLNDGTTIPQLGFGTWQVSVPDAEAAVSKALEVGFRHIDTAAIYANEEGVGKALAASGLSRDDIFVTTKLWNDVHQRDDARRAIETSLTKLGLDHVDLYLIHWPSPVKYGDSYIEAWNAMQEFKDEGLARSIGVSNFKREHLEALEGETPSVDQIEMHPSFAQLAFRDELVAGGIQPEAWSPLGQAKDLQSPVLTDIARAVDRTPAQVVLRWHLQLGNVVIPKSVTPERIEENFDVFGFSLSSEQMAAIGELDAGNRLGADPAEADF